MAETFVLSTPEGPDLEFDGTLNIEIYDDLSGRIRVYETVGGKMVVEQVRSATRYCSHLHRLRVLKRKEELVDHLHDTPGGKAVLKELGMPYRVTV